MLIVSAAQVRAARSLLGMTQPDLALAAGLGLSTIVDFERGRRQVSPEAIHAIRTALERAGISFIPENGGGEGVRFQKRKQSRRGARNR